MGRLNELQAELKKEQAVFINGLPFGKDMAVRFKRHPSSSWEKGRVSDISFMNTYTNKGEQCVCTMWPSGKRGSSGGSGLVYLYQDRFDDIQLIEEPVIDLEEIDSIEIELEEIEEEKNILENRKAILQSKLYNARRNCTHKTKVKNNICIYCKVNVTQ